MTRCRIVAAALALAGLLATAANAGSYFLVAGKIREANPNQAGNAGPYMVVHPPGWGRPQWHSDGASLCPAGQ